MSLWEGRSTECILDANSGNKYFNEDQRNVHVWMSVAPTGLPPGAGARKRWIRLLAGAYSPEPESGELILESKMFYNWIRIICFPQEKGQTRVDATNFFDNRDNRPVDHWLLYMGDDETGDPRRHGGLPHPNNYGRFRPLPFNEMAVPSGHYLLVQYVIPAPNQPPVFYPCVAGQEIPAITQRTITRGFTGGANTKTQTRRSARTRREVRLRDRLCRVSGQSAMNRQRGTNFTGLEVAHIFPLGGITEFPKAFSAWTPSGLNSPPVKAKLYHTLRLDNPPKTAQIDIPENAVLIRADFHAQFDSYEFGFEYYMKEGDHGAAIKLLRARYFESSGAPSLRHDGVNNMHQGAQNGPELNETLVTHHYLTGILWHVAGNGRPSQTEALEALEAETGHH